ncbi:MAG: Fe-S protein assembly co-chaperone HscB [Burkholderiales bacterium]|nr:Fe-S protein assembly co-chaperone HscB [Burkholderiales bacterium]
MFDEILNKNYFQLFGLEQNFVIDIEQLQNKMRELQNIYHPDNFANDQEYLNKALMISSHINHAYKSLQDSQLRATYLLELNGVEVDLVYDTKFSSEFLMAQIEIRERIEEAKDDEDIDELENLETELKKEKQKLERDITDLFVNEEFQAIIELIKQLAFYNKLLIVVDDSISSL